MSSSSAVPLTPRYENANSSNTSQTLQYYEDPKSQDMESGKFVLPPTPPLQQQTPRHSKNGSECSQLSAPFSHSFLSLSPSQNIPESNAQNPTLLTYPSIQQYAGSQAAYSLSQPSYQFPPTTPYSCPFPNEGYSQSNTTASHGGGGPFSGDDWHYHSTCLSGRTSIDDFSSQNVQVPLTRNPDFEENGYSLAQQHSTEPNIMNQTNALYGLDGRRNYPVQYRTNSNYQNSGPYGMRVPRPFCSATHNLEVGETVDSQQWHSGTVNSSIRPGSQWSEAQQITDHVSPLTCPTPGIHPPFMDGSFSEEYGGFSAGLDKPDHGGSGTRNECFLRKADVIDGHVPKKVLDSPVSGSSTVPMRTLPRAATYTTRRSHRRARDRISSGSSAIGCMRCKICDDNSECAEKPEFNGKAVDQKSNLDRHIRENHSDSRNSSHECLLDKNGSACKKVINRARNRRRHVEKVHPTESTKLSSKDIDKRNANAETDAVLEKWFRKVPRQSSQLLAVNLSR